MSLTYEPSSLTRVKESKKRCVYSGSKPTWPPGVNTQIRPNEPLASLSGAPSPQATRRLAGQRGELRRCAATGSSWLRRVQGSGALGCRRIQGSGASCSHERGAAVERTGRRTGRPRGSLCPARGRRGTRAGLDPLHRPTRTRGATGALPSPPGASAGPWRSVGSGGGQDRTQSA